MQVLYGMGDQLAKALAKEGYRVRMYCPYSDLLPGMSYLIRRLLENTANSSFRRSLNCEQWSTINPLLLASKTLALHIQD
jgi:hypothetical protein